MKFCCSISWRVLTYSIRENLIGHFSPEKKDLAERALARWRAVILGKEKHPGEFEQHILPMGLVSAGPSYLKNLTNLYINRSVSLDTIVGPHQDLVYGKMCALLCIGFIRMPKEQRWKGTKVHVRKGSLLGRYGADAAFMRYFLEKSNTANEILDGLSEPQKMKIEKAIDYSNPRVANSKTMEVMYHDYLLAESRKTEEKDS